LSSREDGSLSRCTGVFFAPALEAAGLDEFSSGFAQCVAPLGDLDGDGLPEVGIGEHPNSVFYFEGPRAVYVTSLDREGKVLRAKRIDGRAEGCCETADMFGYILAALGDIDGDGVGDLAVGVPDDWNGGPDHGAVWIFLLARNGSVRSKQRIAEWSGGFRAELRDGAGFGESLASGVDVDRDGVPDLLVGSADGIWTLFLARDGSVKRQRFTEYALKGTPHRDPGTCWERRLALSTARSEAGTFRVVLGLSAADARRELRLLVLDGQGAVRAR